MDNEFKGFRPRAKLEQFTAIPNEFFDEVMKKVSGNELKILLAIFRKTYGWVVGSDKNGNPVYKTQDSISLSQFQELTGIKSINTVKKYIKKLKEKGYIIQTEEHDVKKNKPASYALSKKENLYQTLTEGKNDPVSKVDRGPVSNFDSTKESIKEINKEEDEEGNLPTDIKTIFENIFQRKISPFEESQLHKVENKNKLIIKALKLTALNSKNRTLNYTISLLKDWQEKGITSVQEVDKMIKEYKNKNTTTKTNKKKRIEDPTEGMTEEEKDEYYKELGYR